MISIGKSAPAFKLVDQHDQTHALKDYLGQWVLVYIYPKDDTPGCTVEACAIAEVYGDFKRLGVTVFGLSKDTPQSHRKFAEKYHLPFTLLSDEQMITIDKYGALVEKNMLGKKSLGTKRMSYLINPAGKIANVYPKVDPANHALELLADIKLAQKAYQPA